MKSRPVVPQNHGWIETILDPEYIDYLWERVNKGSGENTKDNLAGNISRSLKLEDEDEYFFNQILYPHVEMYRNMNGGKDPTPLPVDADIELYLRDFWVNHQYEGEFNPYHFHGGMYSFNIWMKIPTDWREQNQLPFLNCMREDDKKPSVFEFEYIDMLGNIRHYGYRLDKSMEGTMVFFPSRLMHTVYPFYNCKEDRVSIAGNLWYNPVKSY